MTVNIIKGDLLESEARYIAHGCNAMGVMGSGVALAIKNKWPEGVQSYFDAEELPMGEIFVSETNDAPAIINAITQRRAGADGRRYVSYDAVDKAMRRAAQYARRQGHNSIAIPKIGAGLGGGDWNVIAAILEKIGDDHGVDFDVYVLE